MESYEDDTSFAESNDEPLALKSLLSDLTHRAETLLSELEEFRQHLRSIKQEQHVEVAHYRNTVRSELEMLQRLSAKESNQSAGHIARSSNLPFLETVWNVAKRSTTLMALQKRVFFNGGSESLSKGVQGINLESKRSRRPCWKSSAVTVDAVTDGGLTWTKVSLVTNTRLLFDLAKQGWQSDGSDDDDVDQQYPITDVDSTSEVPLLKTTMELCQAADSCRVRTRHPKVQLALPRIERGETPEVDAILDSCEAAGAILHCGQNFDPLPLDSSITRTMASDPIDSISGTLNIDCTILLALVSEFSHSRVTKEPWFHTALNRQVEVEGNENLLPALLYPALGNRKLVCTKEAAKRMHEIVDTIGTLSEKARTSILMGDDISQTQAQLVSEMQQWSAHQVPFDWQLPITVIDQNENECQSSLSHEAIAASEFMTSFNKSVFMYGWASGSTTITSNRRVVKQIMNHLDQYSNLDEDTWPKIWLCPTARSLVGKEKRGAKKDGKENGKPISSKSAGRDIHKHDAESTISFEDNEDIEDSKPSDA